jgi:hypothetical protein
LLDLAIEPHPLHDRRKTQEHAGSQTSHSLGKGIDKPRDSTAKVHRTVKSYRVYSTGILARTDTTILEAFKGIEGKSTYQGVARARLKRIHSEK